MKETLEIPSTPMADLVKKRHANTQNQHLGKEVQGTDSAQSKKQRGLDLMAQQQMVATQFNRQQVRESIQSKRIEGSSASESSQVRLVKSAAQNKLLQSQPEKEDELGVQSKKGQSKTMVAPGSLSAYMQMKATLRGKELRAKQSDVLLREHVGKLKTIHTSENQVASSTVIVGSCSRTQPLGHGLEEENEDHMSSDECDMDALDAEFGSELNIHTNDQLNMQIEPQIRQELESERI
ncbi:hypothetical protein SOVF_160630, partial [Spinacia oleracea]